MTRVDSLDSLPAFGLGLALNVRPKAFLLAVAAGLILHTASLEPEAAVVGVAFFTVVATSTVVVPVLLTLLSPTRMQPRLLAARGWLARPGARPDGRRDARGRLPHPRRRLREPLRCARARHASPPRSVPFSPWARPASCSARCRPMPMRSAGPPDAITFFVGSLFFTTASFLQLVQAQSPAMTGVDRVQQHLRRPVSLWAWLPQDRGWLAAATQFPGTLFFNVSTFAALAHNATARRRWTSTFGGPTSSVRPSSWWPASSRSWRSVVACSAGARVPGLVDRLDEHARVGLLHVVGSRQLRPSQHRRPARPQGAVAGTLLGAVCFLVGAILVFPAWRRAVAAVTTPTPREGEAVRSRCLAWMISPTTGGEAEPRSEPMTMTNRRR